MWAPPVGALHSSPSAPSPHCRWDFCSCAESPNVTCVFRQVQFHTGEAQCSVWLFLLCDTGSRFTARTGLEPWILLPQPRVLDLQVCTTVDLGPSLSLIQRDVCRVPRWLSSFEGNQSNSFCSTSVWQEFKLGELVPLLNKATRKWGCLARPVS